MTQPEQKRLVKATTVLYPAPVVLVTCVDESHRPNIITLSWVGVVCSEPPQVGIAIGPQRYSHGLVERSGEFVVNIPTEELLHATDFCGTTSGLEYDKFAQAGLTPEPATEVSAPLIAECPVNLECVVRHRLSLGSHNLFIGEVVIAHIAEWVLNEFGQIDYAKARPVAYNNGEYWALGKLLEQEGFSQHRWKPKD